MSETDPATDDINCNANSLWLAEAQAAPPMTIYANRLSVSLTASSAPSTTTTVAVTDGYLHNPYFGGTQHQQHHQLHEHHQLQQQQQQQRQPLSTSSRTMMMLHPNSDAFVAKNSLGAAEANQNEYKSPDSNCNHNNSSNSNSPQDDNRSSLHPSWLNRCSIPASSAIYSAFAGSFGGGLPMFAPQPGQFSFYSGYPMAGMMPMMIPHQYSQMMAAPHMQGMIGGGMPSILVAQPADHNQSEATAAAATSAAAAQPYAYTDHNGTVLYAAHVPPMVPIPATTRTTSQVLKKKKKFACEKCGREYNRHDRLKSHVITQHSRVNPIACNICKKTFSRKDSLVAHMRVHGENSYHCPDCKLTFSRKDRLANHRKIHESEKLDDVLTKEGNSRSIDSSQNIT